MGDDTDAVLEVINTADRSLEHLRFVLDNVRVKLRELQEAREILGKVQAKLDGLLDEVREAKEASGESADLPILKVVRRLMSRERTASALVRELEARRLEDLERSVVLLTQNRALERRVQELERRLKVARE